MLLFNSPEAIIIRDNPISCGILVKYKVSSPFPLNYGCPLDPQSFVRSAFQMFQRLLFVSQFMYSAGGVLGHITKMSRTEHKRHCTHPSFGPDTPRALCLCPVPSPLLHSWREWNTEVWNVFVLSETGFWKYDVLGTGPNGRCARHCHCKDVLGEGSPVCSSTMWRCRKRDFTGPQM